MVAEAHAHKLKTVIHAASVGAYTLAAQSGTDFITHIPADDPIRPEDITATRNICAAWCGGHQTTEQVQSG